MSVALARRAVWALPLAGLIFVLTVPLRGEARGAQVLQPRDFADHVTSAGYVLGYVGNALGFAVLMFAFFALAAWLSDLGRERLAPVALLFAVTGAALVLPLFGVLAFADRAVGQAYLAGAGGAVGVADRFFDGPLLALTAGAGSLYVLGYVLFAVAVWRTSSLPRWAAVLLVIAPPVLSRPPSLAAEVAASVLLTVAGVGLALAAGRGTTTVGESGATSAVPAR